MRLDLLTATEKAREFLGKSGHLFNRLQKTGVDEAKHEWRLTFDVGIAATQLKTVRVDDQTGKVIALSDPEFIAELIRTRDEYQTNTAKAIGLGEYRKASELLWGALTQQLKALAATREIVITSHRQFFEFLRQFSREREEPYLYQEFVELNALHKNFYDEIIPLDTFPRMYERAIRFIGRLQDLVAEVAWGCSARCGGCFPVSLTPTP